MSSKQNTLVRSKLFAICLLCLCLAGLPALAKDNNTLTLARTGKAFSAVVKKAGPAVVYVRVEKTLKGFSSGMTGVPEDFLNNPFLRRFFGEHFEQFRQQPQQMPRQEGAGSGFIISPDGLILTNNHVVEDADEITVKLADKREFTATVLGTDPQSDVALIKIEANNLPVLPLGDSNTLEVGEWVIAIGSPFELSQSVTVGVVSAKGRNRIGINDYENFIQTDAAINPGNSGGPLLNIQGQAIGINTAIFSRTGGSMGIGFAIPINMAKNVEEQLRSHGKVIRGWLGLVIQDLNDNLAQSFGLAKAEGILVSEVTPASPAEKAGLKQGDVILSFNNSPLTDVSDLRNRAALTAPGSTVTLDIIRNSRRQQFHVVIGEQPADFSRRAKIKMQMRQSSLLEKMGLRLQELTPELATQFGYRNGQGVIIAEVEQGSSADNVGIEPGQLIEEVNRVRVHNLSELKNALSKGKSSEQVLLRIRTGEYSKYVALKYQGDEE